MREIVAQDLMTPNVLSVGRGWSLRETAAFLIDEEISAAVVMDDAGEPLGVVTVTDITAAVADGGARLDADRERPDEARRASEKGLSSEDQARCSVQGEGPTAEDIMNPTVYSVDVSASTTEVAEMMLKGHIHRVLVTEDDALVGVISTSDLLGLFIEGDD